VTAEPADQERSVAAYSFQTSWLADDEERIVLQMTAPVGPARAVVVVLPAHHMEAGEDIHPRYVEFSKRLAEQGIYAIVYEFGDGRRDFGDVTFDWQKHMPRIDRDNVAMDVAMIQRTLLDFDDDADDDEPRYGSLPMFVVGFGFGAAYSWWLSNAGLGLAGVMGFYGDPRELVFVRDFEKVDCPVLMGVVEDYLIPWSAYAPAADTLALADRVAAFGKQVTVEVFDTVPEWLFDGSPDQWTPEGQRAWRLICDFVHQQ
jgi:carboxymethylenebutenolidase